MTRIYLVRHAEAEGNLYRRVHGQYNSLITDRGFRQIAALSGRFRDISIDAVYSSDLYRTMTTARAVYATHDLPLHTDPGLREVAMGEWEDLPWGWLSHADRHRLQLFESSSPEWKTEGGESFGEVRDRLADTLARLAAKHDGQTIAVFSHGMAIRNTLAKLKGLDVAGGAEIPHCDNTGVALLEYRGDRVNIVFMNDNSHLPEELSTFAGQKWWKHKKGSLADANLWYRRLDLTKDSDFYLRCRKSAWEGIYGDLTNFDGEHYLTDAKAQVQYHPDALWQVMLRDKPVGIVQLDLRSAGAGMPGHISFFYLAPEHRHRGLGVQLIGQAVSVYRPLGCDRLRLHCSPKNQGAQRFYAKYGFTKIGEKAGSQGPLDILEKYIGFER